MKVLFLVFSIFLSANSLWAEISSLAIEGYLGDNVHFRLDLAYDSNDGLVWAKRHIIARMEVFLK